MDGKACIRGLRVTVGMVVGQMGAGRAIEDVLAEHPFLERDDILQALRYAAWRTEERDVPDTALDRGYRAMAADSEREKEARAWVRAASL